MSAPALAAVDRGECARLLGKALQRLGRARLLMKEGSSSAFTECQIGPEVIERLDRMITDLAALAEGLRTATRTPKEASLTTPTPPPPPLPLTPPPPAATPPGVAAPPAKPTRQAVRKTSTPLPLSPLVLMQVEACAPPPPPVLKVEPDGNSVSEALRTIRARSALGPYLSSSPLLSEWQTSSVAEDLTADPIPHDVLLHNMKMLLNNDSGNRVSSAADSLAEAEQGGAYAQKSLKQQQMLPLISPGNVGLYKSVSSLSLLHLRTTAAVQGVGPVGTPEVPSEPEPPRKSLLREQLMGSKKGLKDKKYHKYTVTLPPNYKSSLVLELPDTTTVAQTIRDALSRYHSRHVPAAAAAVAAATGGAPSAGVASSNAGLKDDPRAYLLYTADDEGMPETDFPAPEESRKLSDLCSNTFALVDNPEYEKPVILKILIGKHGRGEYVVLPFHAEKTCKEVQKMACQRRHLQPLDYELQFSTLDVAIAPDIAIGDLAVNELRLVKKKPRSGIWGMGSGTGGMGSGQYSDGGSSTAVTGGAAAGGAAASTGGDLPRQVAKILGPTFFFTPETAREAKQYQVVKTGKKKMAGIKAQKRKKMTMLIDGDHITFSSSMPAVVDGYVAETGGGDRASRRLTTLFSGGGSKHRTPIRLSDIVKVHEGKTSNGLVIKVNSDPQGASGISGQTASSVRTYEFESPHAAEIISKLNYLLQLLKSNSGF